MRACHGTRCVASGRKRAASIAAASKRLQVAPGLQAKVPAKSSHCPFRALPLSSLKSFGRRIYILYELGHRNRHPPCILGVGLSLCPLPPPLCCVRLKRVRKSALRQGPRRLCVMNILHKFDWLPTGLEARRWVGNGRQLIIAQH